MPCVAGEYQKLGRDTDAETYRKLAETGPKDFIVSFANPLDVTDTSAESEFFLPAAGRKLDVSRGNYTGALDKIATGLQGSPDSLKLRTPPVDILMRSGRTDEAIAELGEVRHLDGGGSTGRAQLCEIYARNPATRSGGACGSTSLAVGSAWQSSSPIDAGRHLFSEGTVPAGSGIPDERRPGYSVGLV